MRKIMRSCLIFFSSVWYLGLARSQSCPVKCNCITGSSHPSADCSYRELVSVPADLPSNLSQISLSVNSISTLDTSSFAGTSKVKSLWLGHNKITAIQSGTFKDMPKLESLDLGHNQLVDFPWSDLLSLHDLQILILNDNHLVTLPANTFDGSKRLRSLQLSGNKIVSLPEGLFDPLTSLSHLALYNNPLNCSCPLYWLKDWMEKAMITIDKKREITCASPSDLSGVSVEKLPDSQCTTPLQIQGHDPMLGTALLLCKQVGTHEMISKNSKEIKVTIDFLGYGNILVTPIKEGIVYSCHIPNRTEGRTSPSPYQRSGLLQEQQDKLLLIVVSGSGRSKVNAGSLALVVSSYLVWRFSEWQ